jgi:hypothetical protein
MYPGNSVAAVAAYWCANTEALLDFETTHPARSLRIRHEDLVTNAAAHSIIQFLGLTEHQSDLLGLPAEAQETAATDALPVSGCPGDGRIPVELLPVPVLARVNGLHARLGYADLA